MSTRRDFFHLLGPRHGKHPLIRDPAHLIAERAMHDDRLLGVVQFLELAEFDRVYRNGGLQMMADGNLYVDTRGPKMVAAATAITLAATDKLLHPGGFIALPANYFDVGKAVRQTIFGAFTTAATPGNLGQELYYGTADAGGTLLGSSAAPALTASRTSMSVRIEAYCRCRSAGTAGSLLAYALGMYGGASTNDLLATPGVFTPASAPVAVTVDTTAASGFNAQIKRSGSTAETFTTHDLIFEALN
jgi:hypothetical protein